MSEHYKTTFLIEEMQPSWLPAINWQIAYLFLSRLVTGLVVGFVGAGNGYFRTHQPVLWPGLSGLLGGLAAGMATGLVDVAWVFWLGRTKPVATLSEFWQSVLKFLLIAIAVSLSVMAAYALILGPLEYRGEGTVFWFKEGAALGLIFGLLAGLWYGGFFLIQHLTLRLMLWYKGYTPRLGRMTHFLDYVSRRILLQKVGGGYIFIHRYLQEHFVAMKLDG